jgi:hypothetical protein
LWTLHQAFQEPEPNLSEDTRDPATIETNNEPKLSAVELIKDTSRYLRGSIRSELLAD